MIHLARPTVQPVFTILAWKLLFREIMQSGEGRKDGRTDSACESSDHNWLCGSASWINMYFDFRSNKHLNTARISRVFSTLHSTFQNSHEI